MVSICSPTSSACALQTSNTVGNNCRIGNPQQWERQLYALLVVDSANKIGERISKGEGSAFAGPLQNWIQYSLLVQSCTIFVFP